MSQCPESPNHVKILAAKSYTECFIHNKEHNVQPFISGTTQDCVVYIIINHTLSTIIVHVSFLLLMCISRASYSVQDSIQNIRGHYEPSRIVSATIQEQGYMITNI